MVSASGCDSEFVQSVDFPASKSGQADCLRLQMNCSSDCIHLLRAMVAVMTARAGMDVLQSNRVAVAVDELFSNIAKHAYGGRAGCVEVDARMVERTERAELIFDFRDYAAVHWCGDLPAGEACAEGAPVLPGGLGLKLICAVASRCEHAALADGNQWRLSFQINSEGKDECNAEH